MTKLTRNDINLSGDKFAALILGGPVAASFGPWALAETRESRRLRDEAERCWSTARAVDWAATMERERAQRPHLYRATA